MTGSGAPPHRSGGLWFAATKPQSAERMGQLETDAAGVTQNVQAGANIDPDNAMHLAPWGVRFGWTRAEIDALADRLRQLLAKVDASLAAHVVGTGRAQTGTLVNPRSSSTVAVARSMLAVVACTAATPRHNWPNSTGPLR